MKNKYKVAIVTIGLGLVVTLFAAEKQAVDGPSDLILIKSHGNVVAELRVLKTTPSNITCKEIKMVRDSVTGNTTIKGDITIQLSPTDGPPITIKANEIESITAEKFSHKSQATRDVRRAQG